MSWNYRMTRQSTGVPEEPYIYAIREVYYDEKGKPNGWTADAISPDGETFHEAIRQWTKALSDASAQHVLDIDTLPPVELEETL